MCGRKADLAWNGTQETIVWHHLTTTISAGSKYSITQYIVLKVHTNTDWHSHVAQFKYNK